MSTDRTIVVIADSEESDRNYEHQLQQEQSFTYKIRKQQYNSEALATVSAQVDGILLELSSLDSPGWKLLRELQVHKENSPPVVVIGTRDAEIAVQAWKSGATDYLIKGKVTADELRLAMQTAIKNAECQNNLSRDITADKHRELQLNQTIATLQQKYKLEHLIAKAPIGICIASIDGKMTIINDAMLYLHGLTRQEFEQHGMDWRDFIPEDFSAKVQQAVQQVQQEGFFPPQEMELIHRDGTRTPILLSATQWMGSSEEHLVFAMDLTPQKKAQVAIEQLNRELARRLTELQTLLDIIPVGIAIATDPSCMQMECNAYIRHLLGVPFGTQISKSAPANAQPPYRVFQSGEEIPPENLPMQVAARLGVDVGDVEFQILLPNGKVHHLLAYVTPLRDENQAIRGSLGAFLDITERIEVETALRESEKRFREMADHAPMMVWVADTTGNCTYLSKMWYEFTGQTQATGLGFGWLDALHPEDRESARANFLQAKDRHEPLHLEYRLRRQDGQYRWMLDVASPWFADNGEFRGYIGSVIDIHERRQIEVALQEKIQEAEAGKQILDALMEYIPEGITIADAPDVLIRRVSRYGQELTGRSPQVIEGIPAEKHVQAWEIFCNDGLTPATPEALPLTRAVRQGEIVNNEEWVLTKVDGQKIVILCNAAPIYNRKGEITGGIIAWRDISDRKQIELERQQAEQALRESENRLRLAMESAQLGTWDFNPMTQVLRWDEQCKAMFGLSPQADVTYDIFLAGVHPEDRDRTHQVVLQAFNPETGGEYDIEYRTVGIEDGIERWVAARGKAFFNHEGVVIRFIGTVLNITDKKLAEAEREELLQREKLAREAAERANRIKDDFLAVLSHELRSPLSPILGWTKLLQTRKLSESKTAEALATIERNAKLQTQLIDDLLDIAKILRGKLSLNITCVNLNFIIEAALDTVKTAATAKSITLNSSLANISLVSGDAGRLQQIVWNLLSNAIKFTPNGGRVDILMAKVGNQAEITVADTGKGISPYFLPHIFESFQQEDASITRKYGGLGLGLAIVRQLVEAHGGTITADSPGEGLGATFTVSLPLVNVEPEIDQSEELPVDELVLTGIRILAVDDDPDIRELLTVLFTQHGAEVIVVSSAAEVIATIESFQPDVLVSDIGMPEVDGYSLIQQIRTLPPHQGGNVRAIALTAYARFDDQQLALNNGFQRHVTKPLEPEELVQIVVELTQRK